jgi:hypothetical protein
MSWLIVKLLQKGFKMSEKAIRHIEPFTNQFGDVIQPGDAVYSITMCTKNTHIAKGEYLGVIKREGWRGKEELSVQVLVDAEKTAWRWKDTKEDTTWFAYYSQSRELNSRDVEAYGVPYKRVSTLQLNRIVPAK